MLTLDREQIRRIDQYAIETLGIPGRILMENAGRNATDAICQHLGQVEGRRVAIVAGKGNNGGDGFVVARHLAIRGAKPEVFLTTEAEALSGAREGNSSAARAVKIPIHITNEDNTIRGLAEQLNAFDLVVDAVGGTGITGALRGSMASVVEQINQAGVAVAAIDIPTGLDADTGQAEGPAVRAQLTVTFAARKSGFDADSAQAYTGRIVLADIGIDAGQIHRLADSGA